MQIQLDSKNILKSASKLNAIKLNTNASQLAIIQMNFANLLPNDLMTKPFSLFCFST